MGGGGGGRNQEDGGIREKEGERGVTREREGELGGSVGLLWVGGRQGGREQSRFRGLHKPVGGGVGHVLYLLA